MPSPVRRNGSANWYFRGTVPRAVRAKLAAMPKPQRPRGWSPSGDIWISLKTPDRELAKARHAEVAAEVSAAIRSLTSPEVGLNKEERVALAGEAYRRLVAHHKGEPGDVEAWDILREFWSRAGDPDLAGTLEEVNGDAVHHYCAAAADAELRRKGLAVDGRTRALLIEEISQVLLRAIARTRAYADGDYSPDENLSRFPPWPEKKVASAGGGRSASSSKDLTLTDLLDGWSKKKKQPRTRTVDDVRAAVGYLRTFLGHETVSRLSAEDIIRWKDAMVAEGKLSAKTINEKRIALIRALLGWGLNKSNRKITGENVASGIRVEDDKRKERSKSFLLEEARAILKASLAIEVDAAARPGTLMLPAKRWAPWICCYSGARIVEVTQLRRQDVRQVDGIWVLEITPEAGNTKSDTARIVPVHSDLIRQGFIRFVESRPAGPLFYDPSRGREHADGRGKKRVLPESLANRLAHWVRNEVGVTDPRVRPNHGWRHWFVNQCRLHGVDKEARYFMVGHVDGDGRSDVGNSYGDALVPFLKRELEKIPAFNVAG